MGKRQRGMRRQAGTHIAPAQHQPHQGRLHCAASDRACVRAPGFTHYCIRQCYAMQCKHISSKAHVQPSCDPCRPFMLRLAPELCRAHQGAIKQQDGERRVHGRVRIRVHLHACMHGYEVSPAANAQILPYLTWCSACRLREAFLQDITWLGALCTRLCPGTVTQHYESSSTGTRTCVSAATALCGQGPGDRQQGFLTG